MATCAIKWCGKSAKTSSYKKDGITFHRFPRCPERKKKWMDTTSRGDDWFPSHTSVICSRHFTEDNFHIMKNRKRLMDSAEPTLYLPMLIPAPFNRDSSLNSFDKNSETALVATSSNKSVSGSPILATPTKRTRSLSPIPGTLSATDSPATKRLCRRIIELSNVIKLKNKKIKKISDSNRRLKQKMSSLKSVLAELENKNLIIAENNDILNSLVVKCSEIVR